jgi:hypothetical protein
MADLEQRVQNLEQWKNEVSTHLAVRKERDVHIDDRFDRVENRLSGIEESVKRVLWLFIAAAITAGVTFVVKGGLIV